MTADAGAGFRVCLKMHLHPGAGPEFERTWLAVAGAVTGYPGNLGQSLARDRDVPDLYHVTSDWVDEPTFRAFEHSEGHLHHRAQLHPYRSTGSMATMDVRIRLQQTAAAS